MASNYNMGSYYILGREDRLKGQALNIDTPDIFLKEYSTGYTDAENEIIWNTRVQEKVRPFYKSGRD